MQDLISFVQSHAGNKREDLAGEILALLLREEAGQTVLRGLIKHATLDESFIQVETRRKEAGCIPDVHLIQQGRTVALLELKFWAALTTHQLSGRYFRVAPQVMFIVPDERLVSITAELYSLSQKHSLSVLSWDCLLSQLENALGTHTNHDERLFLGALDHLKEFCNVIEAEYFVPFTSDQLRSPVQDAATRHLVWLTREVINAAVKDNLIREAGRLGAGFDSFFFYGQNVVINRFRVWLGYWPLAWQKSPADGPLWVQFSGRDATDLTQSGMFRDGFRLMGNDLVIPLYMASVASAPMQQDEIATVITTLDQLLKRLALVSETLLPPEANEGFAGLNDSIIK